MDRYNNLDGQLGLRHLNVLLATCVDRRSGGPCVHRIDAMRSSRSPSDAYHRATSPEIKEINGTLVPHGRNEGKYSGI